MNNAFEVTPKRVFLRKVLWVTTRHVLRNAIEVTPKAMFLRNVLKVKLEERVLFFGYSRTIIA